MKNVSVDEKALYLHALWDHILCPEADILFQLGSIPSQTKVRGILEHMRRAKSVDEIFGTNTSTKDSFCTFIEDRIDLETKRIKGEKKDRSTEADLAFYQKIKDHLDGDPPLSAKRFTYKVVKHHALDTQQKEETQLFFAKAWTESLCYRFLAAKYLPSEAEKTEDRHAAR